MKRWGFLAPPLLLLGIAGIVVQIRGLGGGAFLRSTPTLLAILTAYFGLADERRIAVLRRWCGESWWRRLLPIQALAAVYPLYALPLGCFSAGDFARFILYVNLPAWALGIGGGKRPAAWRDFAAVAALWLPIELDWLGPLWRWPPGQRGNILHGLVGTVLAAYLFSVVRPLAGLEFRLSLRGKDLRPALAGVAAFALPALAFGWGTGFLGLRDGAPPVAASLLRILGLYFATGIPEELLFRGLIQNLLSRWTGRSGWSVILAGMIFGLAHLNQGPHADWRLFVLASGAGWMYGWVYRAAGSLPAPALAHTLVAAAWLILLRG